MSTTPLSQPVFVTGASGYIGGRLVPRLLETGYAVRCLARNPRKLRSRPWADDPRVEIVAGDIADEARLTDSMRGCGAAYYLVHSMVAAGREYADTDRRLAGGFAHAAEAAGIERVLYLGGLGETGEGLSEHLSSRREVEQALKSGPVPVTVLRAAMIIGSGSASFEILRYLVERLPFMITPRWVRTRCQPIGVRNVLFYLVACLDKPETIGGIFDIGGPDILTYRDIIELLAKARGLPRRWVVPMPVLTPRLSSLWIHLVTPISSKIARPLAEGLKNEVVCRNDDAHRIMPQSLLSVAEAIQAAIGRESEGAIETRWSDAGVIPGDPDWAGGTVFEDPRSISIAAPCAEVFRAVCRVGGGHGWYAGDWLWRLRGSMDRLLGGPRLRRGRRDPDSVSYGDALDFWRVTGIEPDRRVELRAEMKLPGEATLSFDIEESDAGTSVLKQNARFKPKGLLGLAYWYMVLPLHGFVFRGMLHGIRQAAEAEAEGEPARTEPRSERLA